MIDCRISIPRITVTMLRGYPGASSATANVENSIIDRSGRCDCVVNHIVKIGAAETVAIVVIESHRNIATVRNQPAECVCVLTSPYSYEIGDRVVEVIRVRSAVVAVAIGPIVNHVDGDVYDHAFPIDAIAIDISGQVAVVVPRRYGAVVVVRETIVGVTPIVVAPTAVVMVVAISIIVIRSGVLLTKHLTGEGASLWPNERSILNVDWPSRASRRQIVLRSVI